MKPIIDFQECLRDSPKFRSVLEEQENDIEQLEQKLDKVLKMCGLMVDVGKNYVAQHSLFASSLTELSSYFSEDNKVMTCLNKLINALQEMNKFHSILLDQASRTVLKNLTTFVKQDIKSAKESRHYFEKISVDLDSALIRNSQTPKSKPQEVEETQNLLSATRSCFRHTALDYVHVVSILQAKKRHEVLSTLLSYMHAYSTFFHQGSDLCQDLEPFFKKLSDEVNTMRKECSTLEKEMENRHIYVTNKDFVPAPKSDSSSPCSPYIEGYLFKRTSNAFKTWNRRWFTLHNNQLVYRKRSGEDSVTVMEEDLRLCSVKPVTDGERRFCFEVLSPSKSHILQADSEEMYQSWIASMQQGIGAALQLSISEETCTNIPSNNESNYGRKDSLSSQSAGSSISELPDKSSPDKQRKAKVWEQLLKIPGNDKCCDCDSPNPRWASINLGITLCIECSGVHRSLGVHYSKVRSLTLDAWEPEILKVMAELGNNIVNKVYEANVSPEFARATPKCHGNIREAWIKAKYLERKFVKQLSISETYGENAADSRPSRPNSLTARKWSVRRLRRRPRSRDNRAQKRNPSMENLYNVEETVEVPVDVHFTQKDSFDKSSEKNNYKDPALARDNSPSASQNAKTLPTINDTAEDVINPEVLVFGEALDKQSLEDLIELGSDQDSTGGEEDEFIGMEDITKFHPNLLLYKAAAAHNLPVMCQAIALGADKLWSNSEDKSYFPLHQAIYSGSVMACEFLLLNGAKIDCQGEDGRTPLHLATELGHTAQVCLLLKHRADQHVKDKDGITPLDIAMKEANADIVTLLKLALLNDEIRSSELGSTGDDTFNDVVREFSQLAVSHPERLVRSRSDHRQDGNGT